MFLQDLEMNHNLKQKIIWALLKLQLIDLFTPTLGKHTVHLKRTSSTGSY